MRNYLLLATVVCLASNAVAQPEGWGLFAKTKFETKYNEKAAEYFMVPLFTDELKLLVGKEVSLEGYYMPIDVEGNAYIILSKYPYSQCFFCGGAGPESIAEIIFKSKPKTKFESDQYLRVKGKVKLNDTDLEHGNFILTEALIIEK
jgi:hypothetical protein